MQIGGSQNVDSLLCIKGKTKVNDASNKLGRAGIRVHESIGHKGQRDCSKKKERKAFSAEVAHLRSDDPSQSFVSSSV